MMQEMTVMHAAPGEALRSVGEANLNDLITSDGWTWIDVLSTDLSDLGDLPAVLDLNPIDLEDIEHPTEVPRAERRTGYTFFIAHTLSESFDRLRTLEIDIVINDRVLATFHRERSPGLEAIASLAATETLSTPGDVFSLIVDVLARRSLPLLENLDGEIDTLEDLAIQGDPAVPLRVQALRRDVIRLRNIVVRQREAVRTIVGDRSFPASEEALYRISSAYDDYARTAEALETARLLLASVLDTYRATVAERMNDVMKVLTVFSAIVLPLSLMAGIYGMNFANMPELDWRWGYFSLLGIMAVTGLGLWIYFAWRGFIGGPRVPRVDRVVGRGLGAFVHLTQAPIRGLARLVVQPQDSSADGSEDSAGS